MRILPSAFGSEDNLNISGYPEVVDPNYLDAWAEYIRTQTAYELYNLAPRPYGMTYAVLGFLSSISTVSRSFLLKPVQSPLDISIKQYLADIQKRKSDLSVYLKNISFDRYFQLSEVKTTMDTTYNRVANASMVEVGLILVYVPKQQGGKIPSAGAVLHKVADSWFKGKKPKELFNTSALNEVYKKNPKLIRPDVYPNILSLITKRKGWHEWNEKLGLEIVRIQGNAIALRMNTTRMPIFLGTKTKNQVLGKLTNLAKSKLK